MVSEHTPPPFFKANIAWMAMTMTIPKIKRETL